MFAYCGNNPVFRVDALGQSWVLIGTGLAVAGITGLANGYSSHLSGGDFWPAFWIGFGAGAMGYTLSLGTKSPLGLVSIRSFISFGTDVATIAANSGTITADDLLISGWDALMDGLFSPLVYYYNPFSGDSTLTKFLADGSNAFWDGLTDIAETWLFSSQPSQQSQVSNSRTPIRKPSYNNTSAGNRMLLY